MSLCCGLISCRDGFSVFSVNGIAPDRFVQAEEETVVTMTKRLRKSGRTERFAWPVVSELLVHDELALLVLGSWQTLWHGKAAHLWKLDGRESKK